MKTTFTAVALAALPLVCNAQEQPKKPEQKVRVETVHEHKGASHYHKGVVVPTEHHTVTRWHYHNGYKRASEATGTGQNRDSVTEGRQPGNGGAKK